MNRLTIIGWLGVKRAYLNVPKEEAILRWMRDESEAERPTDDMIETIDFEDSFGVYAAWSCAAWSTE